MKAKKRQRILKWTTAFTLSCFTLILSNRVHASANNILGGPTHLGTFEGQTTFTTSSSNGINPGLYLEVMDEYGNYTEYMSEEGVITIDGTKEGAYITQAKLLGKTKYVDQDTGEILDQWEEGRNLKLESVKMPVLKTTGKNLFDMSEIVISDFEKDKYQKEYYGKEIQLQPNTTYTIKPYLTSEITNTNVWTVFNIIVNGVKTEVVNDNYTGSGVDKNSWNTQTFRTDETGVIGYSIYYHRGNEESWFGNLPIEVQLEVGSTATTYEDHKTNILTANEEVELRGVGEVRDELNLLTGELTQRIHTDVLDGNERWVLWIDRGDESNVITYYYTVSDTPLRNIPIINNKITSFDGSNETHPYYSTEKECIVGAYNATWGRRIAISINKDTAADVSSLKTWLSQNPITIQYELATESVKTVDLNSTYEFSPVNTRQVLVEGEILPLICSITTPTEPLSFVLNPNLEEDEQFIAPDFTISNNSPASVSIELKNFEQTTDVLNDVSPTKYQNWSTLDKTQSKDIALAINPKPGDGWEHLQEGPRYAADQKGSILGEIKPNSSVDLTFSALHGQAFTKALKPQYRLVFLFDF